MGIFLIGMGIGSLVYLMLNRKPPSVRIAEAEEKVRVTANVPAAVQQQIDDIKAGMENATYDVLQKIITEQITEAEGRRQIAKLEQQEADLIEGYARAAEDAAG